MNTTRTPAQRPRYAWVTLLAVAFLGCILAVVAAEIAARILFPEWIPATIERVEFWKYDELLGWAQAPHHRSTFHHHDFSVQVVTNSMGLRDDEYPAERTPKKRMLILGDSFGWGFGVEQQQRFSEILEKAYPDWEIINACVPGYGTDQEFLWLRETGIFLKPDAILLLFCGNDFDENTHAERYWYFKPLFVLENDQLVLQNVPVPQSTVRQELQRFFLGKTYLGPILNEARHSLVRLVTGPGAAVNEEISRTEENMHRITHPLIVAMGELCKENRSTFLLVSVPMKSEDSAFLQQVSDKEMIPYLPLDAHFESVGGLARFPHDGHWNVRGHEIAAAAIDTFLWKALVFNSPASHP